METESQERILSEEETPVPKAAHCVSAFPLMETGLGEVLGGELLYVGLRSSKNSSSHYTGSV